MAKKKAAEDRPVVAAAEEPADASTVVKKTKKSKPKDDEGPAKPKRSKWGVWVGNLSYTTTKDDIAEFLKPCKGTISRINLPRKAGKTRGFAYVDFDSAEPVSLAVAHSEQMLNGRPVLIKDASDFLKTGKPSRAAPAPAVEAAAEADKKKKGKRAKPVPSPSLFVGNLGFEVKKNDLRAIFRPFGELVGVRVATFEDNPEKCKGFAYVDFKYTVDATKALRSSDVSEIGGRRTRIEYAGEEATRKGRPWEFDPKTKHSYDDMGASKRAAPDADGPAAATKARKLETDNMAETKLQGLPVEFEGQKITFGD
ncbi:Nucleolar protein 13 [Coemansia nantahalensis]|uniref:Nucleolar protein 13 n=3 Tax=Coemansia TaxID=4863 RepID=A0ACC1K8Y0_9FUNG|nr:Nucleolar protein 13 [Coemansia nantahalensis]